MAKKLMIQGTMSDSGKSFVTAGLCRIFRQDGYRTAPFKSQNMALNSYITKDGLEIGRAQAMQAEAAGIRPSVWMNPILLKPTGAMGSQVIVNGEVAGNWRAMDYYRDKTRWIPDIRRAMEKLEAEYDVIVMEGAGSPAEINLQENDIVNMGMARMAKAPVLLVGDIDRGGVFASLYGTVKLLKPEEQAMIKGIIINKFRGDTKILEPGLRMIEELTGIPVIGVIPMEQIDLDDEDSLSGRLSVRQRQAECALDLAVIRLPHISNFTDFAPLEGREAVSLRYVSEAAELGEPDLLILPGTKNTLADLRWLRTSGLEACILRRNREHGMPVIGICGGFQMLGRRLSDPEQVESGADGVATSAAVSGADGGDAGGADGAAAGAGLRGMGLLDAETVFTHQKTRNQITGSVSADSFAAGSGAKVSGYEIHMGITRNLGGSRETIRLSDGRTDGYLDETGTVFGTYLHGWFDNDAETVRLMEKLAKKKGISLSVAARDRADYKETQYDKLAALVRKSLDMERVYRILEGGI